MGNYQTPTEMRGGMFSSLSGHCLIVASEGNLASLREGDPLSIIGQATMLPLPADAPLPDHAIRGARVLVLEVDAGNEASLGRLARARVEHPEVMIIAALRQADVSLVRTLIRQGVADVAELPFKPQDLAAQILDGLTAEAGETPTGDLGEMIAVVRASGGCGSTSLLTHLGEALSRRNGGSRGVCVADLDLQGGDVASHVGVEPAVNIAALLEAGSRLDEELVRNAITETRNGFGIIAAPPTIAPIDRFGSAQVLEVLRIIRSLHDYVLVDLPPSWTDWSLSVVHSADRILLVTDTSIAGLRQAKRRLKLLNGIHVPTSRVGVVVNRIERRIFRTVGLDEVRDALDCEVIQGVSAEGSALRAAQDQGVLLFEGGKTRFGADVTALAETIVSSGKGN